MEISNVLLIDDNSHQHALFDCYSMNIEVIDLIATSNIEDAIHSIKSQEPDIILLDNRLAPYETFKETTPKLRATGYDGRIVVISSDVGNISNEDMEEHGIYSCMDKFDFDLSSFESKILNLMVKH
ncbi:MAG: hypothetical protein ABJE63_11845 [Lentilitoribacter sp.]